MMVKQPERRTDRCFLPMGSNSVTLVQFPAQRRPPSSVQHPTQVRLRGASGEDGETDSKRSRISGSEEASTNRESASESCDQPGSNSDSVDDRVSSADGVQMVVLESSEDNRAAELASVGGLKVTIQRSSESREFGEKEPSSERLTCHVCHCSCPSAQSFQQHMSGAEHQRRLLHITQSVTISKHTSGRRGAPERWCDVCQRHFTGDVILHRRSKEHKESKKSSRPFCPVCRRHFGTPRKFVEHMKSPEHKQQVQLEKAQDEEMITVDAVGCFESESESLFRSGTEDGGDMSEELQRGDEGLGRTGGVGRKDIGDEGQGRELERRDREGDDGEEVEEGGKDLQHELDNKGIGSKEVGQKETRQGEAEDGTRGNVLRTEPEEHFSSEETGGTLGRKVNKEGGDKELGREIERGERDRGDSKDIGDTDAEELMEVEVQSEEGSGPQEVTPHAAHGDSCVVPVSGFFCRLCHKFFFTETVRDEHLQSQEHLSRVLQSERQRRQPTILQSSADSVK